MSLLDVELRGLSEGELTPMTVAFEDAVFFFSDIDLRGKRQCSDALTEYFHFSVYLIHPGGNVEVIAAGFRLEKQGQESRPGSSARLVGFTCPVSALIGT